MGESVSSETTDHISGLVLSLGGDGKYWVGWVVALTYRFALLRGQERQPKTKCSFEVEGNTFSPGGFAQNVWGAFPFT